MGVKGRYLPDWAILKTVFRISLPAAFERIAMSSAGIITTSTIATLGTVAVAANSLYLTAESICFMPGFAFFHCGDYAGRPVVGSETAGSG